MQETIGVESIRIGGITYTEADLLALDIDRLEELKLKVNSTILEISTQIKLRERETPAPAGADWFIGAKHALSVHQRFMPYLSRLIKKRRAGERPIESYFVDVSREKLEPEDFELIMEEARARKQANGS